MLCMLFLGFVIQGQSQILLKEAKVEYKATPMKIDPATNALVLKLQESKIGEFSKDPLGYVRSNFDISKLVSENKEAGYAMYEVVFKSTNGHLTARFDRNGDLTSSFQNFKNVSLPDEVRLEAERTFKNGKIVSNHYKASSRSWQLEDENYILKIRDGEKLKRLKIKKHGNSYVAAVF